MAYTIGEKLILVTIGLITLYFMVLSITAIIFNFLIVKIINQNLHEFSHCFSLFLITLFGFFILAHAFYKNLIYIPMSVVIIMLKSKILN